MWEFLARQLLKQAGKKAVFNDEANGPEAYADRIKRDFKLDDYAGAWALYDSDRAFWERYYRDLPRPDAKSDFVQDSAAAAGFPGRNNVFEYGFPGPVRPPMSEVSPGQRSSIGDGSIPTSGLAAGMTERPGMVPSAFHPRVPRVSYLDDPRRTPRGLPTMLAEGGAFDPLNPETPPSGGLPGLIREYLRNH
jgi:hypothetical protein